MRRTRPATHSTPLRAGLRLFLRLPTILSMKRPLQHAWTTATLVATAALAIALAVAAVLFTRASAEDAAALPSSRRTFVP